MAYVIGARIWGSSSGSGMRETSFLLIPCPLPQPQSRRQERGREALWEDRAERGLRGRQDGGKQR